MIFTNCYHTTLTKPSLFLSSLQLQNLLYSQQGVLKVADFGLARCFVPGQRLQGKIETLSLMAPEILRGRKYEGPPVDVWASGIVLHYMFTKKISLFQEGITSEHLYISSHHHFYHYPHECCNLIFLLLLVLTSPLLSSSKLLWNISPPSPPLIYFHLSIQTSFFHSLIFIFFN